MSLGKSPAERKADSFAYRRGSHTDKSQAFRLAGKIFTDSDFFAEKKRAESRFWLDNGFRWPG